MCAYKKVRCVRGRVGRWNTKKMQNELVVAAVIISIVVGACASFSTAISQDCEGLQDTFGLAKDATH